MYTPTTLYWAVDNAETIMSGSKVDAELISWVLNILKVTVTVLPIVPAVPVSAGDAALDIPVGILAVLTWLADITNPVFGVIVNTAVLLLPISTPLWSEKVTLLLIVKLLNVISGSTVSVKLLFPETLIDAGIPNPCTDNSFVSILDDVVVSPNILLNLKFSLSLKNLTLPVCWSVVIELAYQPEVSVSVSPFIWDGV